MEGQEQVRTGVLLNDEIERLINEQNLIENHEPDNIQPASYDVRLGEEYYQEEEFRRLDERENPVIRIAPDELVMVTSYEALQIPSNVVARYWLRLSLMYQGLVLGGGGAIDPGYRGRLFCWLYNISGEEVVVRYREHFATLEFVYTTPPTAESKSYEGPRQGIMSLSDERLRFPFGIKSWATDLRASVQERLVQMEGHLKEERDRIDSALSFARKGEIFMVAVTAIAALATIAAAITVLIVTILRSWS